MRDIDYGKWRRHVEERYCESCENARSDRDAGLAAIETVRKLLSGPPKKHIPAYKMPYGSRTKTIRKALQYVSREFTVHDVLAAMKQVDVEVAKQCTAERISVYMYRLKRDGVVVVVRQGKGRTPNTYSLGAKAQSEGLT